MRHPYCSQCDSLARDSSSKIVGAETNMGRVDIASSGGSHSVGESTVDGSVRVASIASVQESRVSLSLSLTLAKVVSVVTISIRSIALGRGVKSLGDGVKTSAGAEGDAVVSRVEDSGVSLGLSLTLAKVVDIAIASSTGDRDVSSVDTGGTLETSIHASIWVAMVPIPRVEKGRVSLGRDGGHEGRCYDQKFHDDDTALIF